MQQFIDFGLRHWELCLGFLVVLLMLIALEVRNRFTGYPQLTAHEATILINRQNALVLDIRDQSSFAKGHIIDAVNIPLAEFEGKMAQLEKYKKRPIVIVYSNGQQFVKIANQLQNQGFLDISSLKSGITTWQNAGLPLVKD